jgi:hypothetical protein
MQTHTARFVEDSDLAVLAAALGADETTENLLVVTVACMYVCVCVYACMYVFRLCEYFSMYGCIYACIY